MKRYVLVVDDEPGILHFIDVSLQLAGYEVITATSGEEALRLARFHNPDVMLLDILMQPLSGLDVLDELRTFSQMPVIVISAQREIQEIVMKKGPISLLLSRLHRKG